MRMSLFLGRPRGHKHLVRIGTGFATTSPAVFGNEVESNERNERGKF